MDSTVRSYRRLCAERRRRRQVHALPAGFIVFFIEYAVVGITSIVRVVSGIIAAVAANRGRGYVYPLAFRFAKA